MITRITLFTAILISCILARPAEGDEKSPANKTAAQKQGADKAPADKLADPRIDALQRKIDDLEAKLDSKPPPTRFGTINFKRLMNDFGYTQKLENRRAELQRQLLTLQIDKK